MNTLTITYKYKYCISFAESYVFTTCGICVNLKTNRIIKKVKVGGSIGYVIASKFYSLKFLKPLLVSKIKEKLPF